MSSFSKMSVWPVGYFRAFSSWLLRHRREVAQRIDVINAEIQRIGDVHVTYATQVGADGSVVTTEQRVGFAVTPKSSLGKLMRAYVAAGGNPLDISPFMKPNSSDVMSVDSSGNPIMAEMYPHGGIAAPMSAEINDPQPVNGQSGFGPHPGGYINMDSYYPARQNGRLSPGHYDHDAIVRNMHHMRAWANQDISERLRRLEWQIVKLCDLREQLTQERDEVLMQAFGGALDAVGPSDGLQFNPAMGMQALVQEMYDLVFDSDADGNAIYRANDQVPLLRFALLDVPSEVRDPLGC